MWLVCDMDRYMDKKIDNPVTLWPCSTMCSIAGQCVSSPTDVYVCMCVGVHCDECCLHENSDQCGYKTNITSRLFLSLSPSLCNFTLIVSEIDLSYIPKARYYISRSHILSPSPTPPPNPYTPSHTATNSNMPINGVVHPAL